MSKSAKKQKARARAQAAEQAERDGQGGLARPPATLPAAPLAPLGPAAPASPVDEDLLARVLAAVQRAGYQTEDGAWLYNGDVVSIKYVAEPRRVMVAGFKRGVVFQVEGERQVVRQGGGWEDELQRVSAPAEAGEDGPAG